MARTTQICHTVPYLHVGDQSDTVTNNSVANSKARTNFCTINIRPLRSTWKTAAYASSTQQRLQFFQRIQYTCTFKSFNLSTNQRCAKMAMNWSTLFTVNEHKIKQVILWKYAYTHHFTIIHSLVQECQTTTNPTSPCSTQHRQKLMHE